MPILKRRPTPRHAYRIVPCDVCKHLVELDENDDEFDSGECRVCGSTTTLDAL